jgi:hypothetical protein
VALAALGPIAVMVLKNRAYRQNERNHWLGTFAQEVDGTFHPRFGDAVPTFGIAPGTFLLRPLAEVRTVRWVEFTHRGHRVIAADDDRPRTSGTVGAPRETEYHSVQLRVPASPTVYVSTGRSDFPARAMDRLHRCASFDEDFDSTFFVRAADRETADTVLTPETRRWMLTDPRVARYGFAVEDGTIRTRSPGHLTRDSLWAETDYLIDLTAGLPAAFWKGPVEPDGRA